MDLRTAINIEVCNEKLNQKSKIITFGSCFSDVLGKYFIQNKVNCLTNPFGTVYNIFSLSKLIEITINKNQLPENQFTNLEETYLHHDLHSNFSGINKTEIISKFQNMQNRTGEFLSNSNFLILTLGTSWVYENKNGVISNCHKQDAGQFNKRILTIAEQFEKIKSLNNQLLAINPNLKIILSVSPVRHLKDGISENSISKAILRILCEQAVNAFQNISYFPSFEIMMDDLRDYRFYKNDLIHPTELAESYIISKFSEAYFDKNLLEFIKIWTKIKQSIQHRPLNSSSKSHQTFLKKLYSQLQELNTSIDCQEEIEIIQKQIIEL